MSGPTFYRQVVIHNLDSNSLRLYQLLLDCLQQSDVAFAVKTIVVQSSGAWHGGYPEDQRYITEDHEKPVSPESPYDELFSKALEPLQLGNDTSNWLESFRSMQQQLLTMQTSLYEADRNEQSVAPPEFHRYATILLLMLCPNVEHFVYDIHASRELANLLRRNNYGQLHQRFLQQVKRVTILPGRRVDIDHFPSADPLAAALSFHRLPGLESFSMRTIRQNFGGGYETISVPKTSSLKSLSITNAYLCSDVLAPLIRMPRALEKFVYSNGKLSIAGYAASIIRAKTIAKALWTQRASLTEIDLMCDLSISIMTSELGEEEDDISVDPLMYNEGRAPDPEQDERVILDRKIESEGPNPLCPSKVPVTREYRGTIGSLHDFTVLKRLSIGAKLLLGQGEKHISHIEWEKNNTRQCTTWEKVILKLPVPLSEALPPSLEYLRIRGYRKGEVPHWDEQVEELLAAQQAGRLPNLQTIEGVEERITTDLDVPRPKPHDPHQPKRAMTSYFKFMDAQKSLLKLWHPDWTASELSEEIERRWSALAQDDKAKLNYAYLVDNVRYYKQMEEYNAGRTVPTLSWQEAEDLHDEWVQSGKLVNGRFVVSNEEHERREREEREMKEVTTGPDYEWIEIEMDTDHDWVKVQIAEDETASDSDSAKGAEQQRQQQARKTSAPSESEDPPAVVKQEL